jgi:hypothetical protein
MQHSRGAYQRVPNVTTGFMPTLSIKPTAKHKLMPIPRFFSISALLVVLVVLSGCVANRSYWRSDAGISNQLPPVIDPIKSKECGTRKTYECVRTAAGGYQAQHFYLAHIEFDDMGELWSIGDLNSAKKNDSQLDSALATIDKAQEIASSMKREVVVITFVHGWHNNASPYDEEHKDLGSFKTVLQDLSDRYSRDFPNTPPILVGIFISWRGQVFSRDLVATYWNRRNAAVRIGSLSLTEVIVRLMFQTKGVPLGPDPANSCQSNPAKKYSHFVVIGHSFGARALEHAVAQPMLSLVLERQAQAQECIAQWNTAHNGEPPLTGVSFVAPADLVVFLNAANDALEMKSSVEALKRSKLTVLRTDDATLQDGASGPFLISITSDGDWATETVMPIAQSVSMPGLAFRKYDKDACEKDQLCTRKQSYYYRHSAASIKEMRSHTVYDQNLSSSDCRAAEGTDDSWPYFVAAVNGAERCFKIEANSSRRMDRYGKAYPPWNTTPAFIIGVPKTLIPSHTDVFQDGTEELLITIANHYDKAFTATTRMNTPAR